VVLRASLRSRVPTAYGWKKEDQEFDAAWVDAVENALDALETQLYDSALAGNSSDTQFILKHRRREVYGNVDDRPQHGRFTPEAIAETGAYSRTGAAGAQAAPADRVTCVAAHQDGIQRPDGFSSFASAPSARAAAVMNAFLAVRTSALSSLTLSEPHARLGVIEKFNS